MNFAEIRMRNQFGVGPAVAIMDLDTVYAVWVTTRVGTWFRHMGKAFIEKYRNMGCLRKVLVNDFYYDQDFWCRSSRPIPGGAEEVY